MVGSPNAFQFPSPCLFLPFQFSIASSLPAIAQGDNVYSSSVSGPFLLFLLMLDEIYEKGTVLV